jgi:hypothetical protein
MMGKKIPKWSRLPTAVEIAAFDGLHCHNIYRWAVRNKWCCPCCDRSAQELIRWSEIRGPGMRVRYGDEYGMGFTIQLGWHHCHSVGPYARHKTGRFKPALICGDCNAADAAVKRKLNLPPDWSFAPSEIRQFVRTIVYSGRTIIDYEKAAKLYLAFHASELEVS